MHWALNIWWSGCFSLDFSGYIYLPYNLTNEYSLYCFIGTASATFTHHEEVSDSSCAQKRALHNKRIAIGQSSETKLNSKRRRSNAQIQSILSLYLLWNRFPASGDISQQLWHGHRLRSSNVIDMFWYRDPQVIIPLWLQETFLSTMEIGSYSSNTKIQSHALGTHT